MDYILKRKNFLKINEEDIIDTDIGIDAETPEEPIEEKSVSWEQKEHEIKIPDYKRKSFDKFMKKLNRMSRTIGFPEPIVTELGKAVEYLVYKRIGELSQRYEEVLSTFDEQEALSKTQELQQNNKITYIGNRTYDRILLIIVDDIRPMEDWVILGTVDYKDGLIKPAPTKEIPMDIASKINLTGKSNCDHCNKTINRNKTVFVQNVETEEIKQIGGICTKYYLGLNYQRVLSYLESIHEMGNLYEYDEDWRGMDFEEKNYSVLLVIKHYIWLVNRTGNYVSKKAATAYNDKIPENDVTTPRKISTGEEVVNEVVYISYPPELTGLNSRDREESMNEWAERSDEFYRNISTVDQADVQEILDFIESKKEESNFMFNVSNKLAEGVVPDRILNYISGACSFYFGIKIAEKLKAEALEKNKTESTSKHIGTIGEKSAFKDLEVIRINQFQTEFGFSNIYTMKDVDGNIFTKFGTINDRFISDDSEEGIQVGTKLSFTSDVKDHKDFKGVDQTIIGRLSKYNSKLGY